MSNVVILAPSEEPVTPCDRMYLRIKRGVLRLKAEALAEELAKTEREIAIYSASLCMIQLSLGANHGTT